ncbi:ribosome maturation factor RimM [Paradevosia shaoguanensis]|uniref:ribosome maturation factor RimM n=1 Tax=Paradevosia shaoguanensis TaxID=1335043 RepID=UPI001933C8FE|nr:ribosome maturation factor RimM [Paradevosia shaoguanensis]
MVGGKADDKNRLLLGRIGAAHGIKGEVRITPFTGEPLAIASYGPLDTDKPGVRIEIASARSSGNVVIARIKGVSDRNEAEKLNGVDLYVDRARLPETDDEDDFYHADLIGLEARLTDGRVLGEVISVPNFGASDLIEVRDGRSGDTFLFPFTRQVVPEVRIADGYLVIEPPVETGPGEAEEPN